MRLPLLIAVLAATVVFTSFLPGKDAVAARSYKDNSDYALTGEAGAELAAAVAGKRGDGLVAALRRECRLERLCDFSKVFDGYSQADPFTGTVTTIDRDASTSGLTVAPIVPSQWWTDSSLGASNLYGDTVALDLHNLALMAEGVRQLTGTHPCGLVTTVTADHGSWRQGTIAISGFPVTVNEPCESLRGRVARAYLYMALMYPQAAMAPEGMMVMKDGGPELNDYWRDLLLQWHENYPPEQDEIDLARRANAAQGGANPLILLPDIASYIWGDKRGEVYNGANVDPGEVPLHGTYKLAEVIVLKSAHVPDDARWSVDGRAVSSQSVPASSLGLGDHRLEYVSEATGEHGCVKIIINQ